VVVVVVVVRGCVDAEQSEKRDQEGNWLTEVCLENAG